MDCIKTEKKEGVGVRPADVVNLDTMKVSNSGHMASNLFGRTVVYENISVPIDHLKFNQTYQRSTNATKIKVIDESIKESGFWGNIPVEVNEAYEIIDGQNRVEAAKQNNIPSIKVTVLSFPNKELEAKYYVKVNSFVTNLSPKDEWAAKFLSKDPIAIMLYNLELDHTSELYGLICFRDKGKNSKDKRLTISQALFLINYFGFNGGCEGWRKSDAALWHQKSEDPMNTYPMVRNRINEYLKWFFKIATKDKKQNPTPFRDRPFRAMARFYKILEAQQKFRTTRGVNGSITKMKKFAFANGLESASEEIIISNLVRWYNKGRKNGHIDETKMFA